MESAQTILVIIVSAVLAIFLTVSIILLVVLVKLVRSTRRAVAKAEHIIDNAEAASDILRNAGGPIAVLKIIRNIINLASKIRK